MKEPTERTGTKESSQQTSMREPSGTIRWVVLALLVVAALILLVPMPDVTQDRYTARIVLSTIILAICGIIAIWNKPTD